MALKIIVMLVSLFICSSSHGSEARMSISWEEDMELERQLKILNKPAVRTIQTKEGDIIDCIDINKQPGLDHPLLKNHKIQIKPDSFPAGMTETPLRAKSLQFKSRREACPSGTVPIQRTLKEDLIRTKHLSKQLTSPFPDQHLAFVRAEEIPGSVYHGASGYVSVYNVSVEEDQFSSANIWIEGGPLDQINVITAGWMVQPRLYGDTVTRLFTYWTGDGYKKTGCYNTLCIGFIQLNEEVTPNYPFTNQTSTYGGHQYDVKLLIYQDPQSGNWWFLFSEDNIAVGYWPKEIFTHLRDGAKQVAWGGIAKAGTNGLSPPMGNGYLPDGHYNHACYFRLVKHITEQNGTIPPDLTGKEYVDKSGCYGLKNDKSRGSIVMGYSFTFGGPGGGCGN